MGFESRNPTTGELIAQYPEHTPAQVEDCLARAWSGWRTWPATPLNERTAFLNRLADVLEARVDEFAKLMGGVKSPGFGRELGALGARELANAKLLWQGQ